VKENVKTLTTIDCLKYVHMDNMDSERNGELSSNSNWRETDKGVVYRKNIQE